MLVSLGGCRKGLRHGELRVEELNDIFGLADLDGDIGDAVIVSALRHLHRDMEDEACAVDPDS
ncbi:hypothetical protein [Burkholderia vietnamiensis]|uniref:hypothetical protein n=1 Tax=Burkholderia vietnamiensis TaxID=60552 RepID=UPI0012D90EAA|nr:hypothetical protein [Burkholderia vietnamiensis]MDN7926764.1 hypothetical protein [Burkholderia vietnamiensis]HDR9250815.1 hypothetical protein [Burkholderia vietnamiensis]